MLYNSTATPTLFPAILSRPRGVMHQSRTVSLLIGQVGVVYVFSFIFCRIIAPPTLAPQSASVMILTLKCPVLWEEYMIFMVVHVTYHFFMGTWQTHSLSKSLNFPVLSVHDRALRKKIYLFFMPKTIGINSSQYFFLDNYCKISRSIIAKADS